MSYRDERGLEHSGDPGAAGLASDALLALLRYRGDPMTLADKALEQDPGCIQAYLIKAHALTFSLHPQLLSKARDVVNEARGHGMTQREAEHLAAIDAWLDGRFDQAARNLGGITTSWPHDLLASMFAHQADFFSGVTEPLKTRPQAVLETTPKDMPGRGFVVGMAAFGHEEAGDYTLAQELADEALAFDREDVWAIHAMAHVLEMQGDDERGIAWYRKHQSTWSQDCFFACHNWWHLALYHIDRLETGEALSVYDQGIAPDKRSITLNLCDAIALLWRLHLMGCDVGARMNDVVGLFLKHKEKRAHIFNDVHLALALAATEKFEQLEDLEQKLCEVSGECNRYGQMLKKTGLPALAAFRDFAQGRFLQSAERLETLMADEALMTGSHAQRDLLPLTLIEAQFRAGRKLDAIRAARHRLELKPKSAKWQQDCARA